MSAKELNSYEILLLPRSDFVQQDKASDNQHGGTAFLAPPCWFWQFMALYPQKERSRVVTDPIEKFKGWWIEALSNSPVKHKNAICVSTVDADGCPNARFVDLKAVEQAGFTFCSYYDSAKGREISINSIVALTIWWDHVGYQVRVVGRAGKLSEQEADKHWVGRSAEAQLTTSVSEQSEVLKSLEGLQKAVESARLKLRGNTISRPVNWGGYLVVPDKIEFLTFKDDRLHLREQFTRKSQAWEAQLLQP